jgi:hypothetical protein
VSIKDREQPFRLHRKAIQRVFELLRRVRVEVAEAAADVRRAALHPEDPGEALCALPRLCRQEGVVLGGRRNGFVVAFRHPFCVLWHKPVLAKDSLFFISCNRLTRRKRRFCRIDKKNSSFFLFSLSPCRSFQPGAA